MKNNILKKAAVLLIVALSLTGILGTMTIMAEETAGTYVEGSITNEQAKLAFQNLMEQTLDYVRNEDYNAFASLYRNASEEAINSDYQYYHDTIIGDGYPDFAYTAFAGDGTHFMGFMQNSLTSGYYPDYRTMQHNTSLSFSYVDGEWKFDYSEEIMNALNQILLNDYYPAECMQSAGITGNGIDFSNGADFSWVNEDIVIPGSLAANIYLAWQNEDGSVGLLLNVKNGTNEIRAMNSITVTFTDDTLGTIFNETFSGENIAPGKAKNYLLTVDAARVMTGRQKWGSVHYDVDTQSN